ncbi:hypothetical protein R5P42_004784 [Escherichia coli]|nr:hypothetical protein [Escherichia coli]
MTLTKKNSILFLISCLSLPSIILAADNIKTPQALLSQYDSQKAVKVTIKPEKVDCKPYDIYVHNPKIEKLIRNRYTYADINDVIEQTKSVRNISIIKKKWGTFIEAASFADAEHANNTHYNAIWLRDSLWGYLALNSESSRQADAKAVLLTLWDYLSSPEQLKRMENVIKDPSVLNDIDGQMKAVHIRFDSNSPEFEDVLEKDHPQPWTHKQNDALGFFIDTLLTAIKNEQIQSKDWTEGRRMEAFVKLIAYIQQIHFYEMPDSGMWEETSRVNTSSVGFVTSGLENLFNFIYASQNKNDNSDAFRKTFIRSVKKYNYQRVINKDKIEISINAGYNLIKDQLILGGESPAYEKTDKLFRTADAALLSLIYPARLSRLSLAQKQKIMNIVQKLEGNYGIKRYENDNYQSANFWFNGIKTDTDSSSYKKRRENFIEGTEAQWFFDSWYGIAALQLFHETNDSLYFEEATKHLNRALAQITDNHVLGADGQYIVGPALPESYNFLTDNSKMKEFPSPITPLNWAKATLTLLLDKMLIDITKLDPACANDWPC